MDCGWLPYQSFFFSFLLNGMMKAEYSAHTKESIQLEATYELKSRVLF